MSDEDGFDGEVPEELRPWFEDRNPFEDLISYYILVESKIKKVDQQEWSKWFSNLELRVVDSTPINDLPNYPNGDRISTVFLGLTHGKDPITGLPFLFESMVFGGQYDNCGWRYTSLGDAKRGHWHIYDCLNRGEKPHVDFGEKPIIEDFLDALKDINKDKGDEDDSGEEKTAEPP